MKARRIEFKRDTTPVEIKKLHVCHAYLVKSTVSWGTGFTYLLLKHAQGGIFLCPAEDSITYLATDEDIWNQFTILEDVTDTLNLTIDW